MKPYSHEFRHLLHNVALIAVIGALAAAGTLGYATIESSRGGLQLFSSGFWYYSGDTYHVDLWTFDTAGNPVSDVDVSLNVTGPGFSTLAPVVFSKLLSTNSQGEVSFNIPLQPGNYSVSTHPSYPAVPEASVGYDSFVFVLTSDPSGGTSTIGTPYTFNVVTENFYSTREEYLVVWGGPTGGLPTGDPVVACSFVFTFTRGAPLPTNCSGQSGVSTQVLGSLTGYRTTLPLPAAPTKPVGLPPGVFVLQFVEILSPTGAVLASAGATDSCMYECSYFVSGPGPSILGYYTDTLALLPPLMALFLAFWIYARPRLSGTLEPVVARPVTQEGLFLLRYGTTALALLAGIVAEVLLLDVGVTTILREPLPPSFILPLVGGFAVASIGFAGIVFLSAHLTRSVGLVLSIGVGLAIALSLLWTEAIEGVGSALGWTTFLTQRGANFFLTGELLAPPQFPAAVVGLLSGASPYGPAAGDYGSLPLTSLIIGLAGIVWLVVPFLLTYWRAKTRD